MVDVETRLGAVLPDQYRTFLTDVAGGAGPDYGLLGFRMVDGVAR